jgi:alpha-beta hydrolase superfamily lysophospholipase
MKRPEAFPTNLELRESNPDGSEGSGLSHTPGGMFLLHVLELAAEGEPRGGVTILHGAGDHGARYLDLAHVFAADGWAVSMPDMRGHGRSEGPRGHSAGMAEIVRDLSAVQDHLCFLFPEGPQVLVGQGLGGLYALRFALERPERVSALVLVGPWLQPRFEPAKASGGLLKLFKRPGPTSTGPTGIDASYVSEDPEQQAAWRADELVHALISQRAAESALEAAREVRARLAEIEVPLLVLRGERDALVTHAQVEVLAGARRELRELPGVGHDAFHDRGAAELARATAAWVNRAVPR